jgi:hypothetical protein
LNAAFSSPGFIGIAPSLSKLLKAKLGLWQ